MVLKRADFGKCEKSSQTLLNVAYLLENEFLTAFGLVRKDSVRIHNGPKSTDFDRKGLGYSPWF